VSLATKCEFLVVSGGSSSVGPGASPGAGRDGGPRCSLARGQCPPLPSGLGVGCRREPRPGRVGGAGAEASPPGPAALTACCSRGSRGRGARPASAQPTLWAPVGSRSAPLAAEAGARVKERAARWAEGPAAPPRGPGPAVPRLLRPGRPLARRLPGACSPRVPGTGRAAPRRPSAPARAAELGPQEPPARTCPRAGPPQPPPDAARWLRALDVITLSAVRAPDFVSICRKEVIELKKSLMTFLAGWSQWIPPGRCSALLRRGSRGGTRVAAGPPTQRSLQEKAPCKVFWKTSSRKENSTPDYPYKEL
ncbi:cortistatin, partial [Canis lupus baileyi]|uniref:cortistatin n=1 Tax=Canis lupus baileyi TaxID=143281 RepID=UPI003B976786